MALTGTAGYTDNLNNDKNYNNTNLNSEALIWHALTTQAVHVPGHFIRRMRVALAICPLPGAMISMMVSSESRCHVIHTLIKLRVVVAHL